MTFTLLPTSTTWPRSGTDPADRRPVLDIVYEATLAPDRGASEPRQ